VLGVGLFLRRDVKGVIARLGLRIPTAQDITLGIGAAGAMLIFTLVLSAVWSGLVSPEEFAEQTAASQQMTVALGTIPIALLVSVLVAFGEEIFFRGALQPIFGLGLSSIFFTLLHIQYTLTPASIAILVLAVVLGLVRARASTTAAIIAHFLFNFAQLALAITASSLLGGS
jgi:membrane protease YdiL (CAAX protease family)